MHLSIIKTCSQPICRKSIAAVG